MSISAARCTTYSRHVSSSVDVWHYERKLNELDMVGFRSRGSSCKDKRTMMGSSRCWSQGQTMWHLVPLLAVASSNLLTVSSPALSHLVCVAGTPFRILRTSDTVSESPSVINTRRMKRSKGKRACSAPCAVRNSDFLAL